MRVGDVSRVPASLSESSRRAQRGLLGRRDEHKREADWCVDDLTLIKYMRPHGYYTRTLLGATPDNLIVALISS